MGANKDQLEKGVFDLAQRIIDENKMTQSFKVFNPFKKLPILFESKGNCKVMLTKIKELVNLSPL